MEINVHDSINGAKAILDDSSSQSDKHGTFCPVYAWTNESAYEIIDVGGVYRKEKVLSILASGDQVFSMLDCEINDIDTFDINALTEYYALGLKRAMILKYDYYTFGKMMIKFFSPLTSHEEVYEIIKGLFPYMEKRHSLFWQELIDYDAKLRKNEVNQKNLIITLTRGARNIAYLSEDIPYLAGERHYNLIKEKLSKTNISFETANAEEIDKHFTGPYDFIYLSNVIDFFESFGQKWGYDKLREYEERVRKIASNDASIIIKYALNHPYPQSLFKDSCTNIEDSFQDEEIFKFRNSRDSKDAIVLIRKK